MKLHFDWKELKIQVQEKKGKKKKVYDFKIEPRTNYQNTKHKAYSIHKARNNITNRK